MQIIRDHTELEVYKVAFELAMQIFDISKSFPKEEKYSLTDQIRRSSRSVCANLAEAFRKRQYEKHFKSKLSDSEAEAAETKVWLQFALKCRYITNDEFNTLTEKTSHVLGMLVNMQRFSSKWTINLK